MSSVLVYLHLGLGDHLMCHGIIREYAKKYSRVALFALPHNYESVAFMFRDLPNVEIIKADDAGARKFIEENKTKAAGERFDEVKIIGFEFLDRASGIPVEKQFYKIAGVPFEKKWDSFYVERDLAKEQALFDKIAPKSDYIFLHEDASRGYGVNRKRVRSDLPIIVADPKVAPNMFDYCTIIERAKEIHVFDSSFMFLVDCLQYSAPDQKLFIHRYARSNPTWKLPIMKKDWHILLVRNYGYGVIRYVYERLFQAYNFYIIKSYK